MWNRAVTRLSTASPMAKSGSASCTAVASLMRRTAAAATCAATNMAHANKKMHTRSMCGVHTLFSPSVRNFSSAAASPSTSSSSAAPSSSSSASVSGANEIKIMAYYLAPETCLAIQVPSNQASRAYRFTQPNSVFIPLDDAAAAAAAGAPASSTASAASTTLSDLFSLPAKPVAPIVRIPSASSTPTSSTAVLPPSSSLDFDHSAPFVVVFKYGAVVFFNVSEAQQKEFLGQSRSESAKLHDDYRILLTGRDRDPFSCRFLTDSVEISGMDLNSVRILSQILSQTTAMQHYENEANRLLVKLRAMLRTSDLQKGVSSTDSQQSDLIVKYVAESSTAMVDVLTELKLLDRSEIVWGHGAYDPLWSGLRREFDLSDRWEALQTKLDLLASSHPFFLQVIATRQTHRMEIIIIALIATEVVLSIGFHMI